jgi:hydrogenase maturation protease
VVIGLGNEFRRDDGFGPRVLAELAARRDHDGCLDGVELRVSDGEPARLLDAWDGTDLAVVVDVAAGRTGPGSWTEVALPDAGARHVTSGHDVGLGDTVALARVLGRLPERLVVLVAYGEEFGFGVGLSEAVAAAIRPVADRVCTLVGEA